MAKAEFLMLAHNYNPKRTLYIRGWYVSEKLDGQRCFWDGGVSIGQEITTVPWANPPLGAKNLPLCTGLWTRYGKPIYAPKEWYNRLPRGILLDGELWCGREARQELTSIIKQREPSTLDWKAIEYHVFDSPPYATIFADRTYEYRFGNKVYTKEIKGAIAYAIEKDDAIKANIRLPYTTIYNTLAEVPRTHPGSIHRIEQHQLNTEEHLSRFMQKVLDRGGEGVMLRHPAASYVTERSHSLLKLKPVDTGTAIVIGWKYGVGKYEGMMGSLEVYDTRTGVEFDLSGFTDEERQVIHGGCEFPQGTQITYKHRGVSKDGVPIEARFHRGNNGQD